MLTVVTPATNRRLTTVATLEAELGLTDLMDAAVRLPGIIDRASAMIVGHCRRPFALESYVETFRPGLDSLLILSRTPAKVTSVTSAGIVLAAEEWEADGPAGLLSRGPAYRVWGADVSVAYQAGYTLPGDPPAAGVEPLPGDVEQACITLATALYRGGARDPMLRSESTEGVGATSWIATAEMGALPPQVVDMLAPYRRMGVG